MKGIICFVVALVFASPLMAQHSYSGKVVDSEGNAAAFATVSVRTADSTVVSGASADAEGLYQLNVNPGSYLLAAELVGYLPTFASVTLKSGSSELPTLVLQEDRQMLGEAVVSAVMPKTTLTGEGIQTSVRGTVLENVGTAKDVLSKTPGLIKSQDGLEVIGKGAPLIYINGRKVTDKHELDRLLSSEIQSVEVITNPGAQYDASVRAVVRIRTIRRQGDGFGFNLGASDEQSLRVARYNDPSFNLDANYRVKSVDIFAGLDISHYTWAQTSDKIWQKTFGTPESIQDGSLRSDYSENFLTLNGGVNWQIADNHSVGFKVDWSSELKMRYLQELKEKVYLDGKLIDDLEAIGESRNDEGAPSYLKANAYYNGRAGKLGIDFNIDYYGIKQVENCTTKESSKTSPGAEINTRSEVGSNLVATKLVLSYPIWKGSFQLGTEETFTRRSDIYSVTGTTLPSSQASVSDDNVAAFANYGFNIEKVGQFSAGVRYEHVNYLYDDKDAPQSNFSKRYNNVFPTLSYAGAFGDYQLMANYGIKTARPGYYQLSNAIHYNSRYILQSGNAALQPQIINDASLTLKWKYLVGILNYSRTDNSIQSWSSRYEKGSPMVLVKPRNLDNPMRKLSFFVNATPTIGIWTMNYTVGIIQQWLKIHFTDEFESGLSKELDFSNKPMAFARLLNTFTVKKGWQFELGGEYHSKAFLGNLYIDNNYFNLTAAVQKTLLKDGSLVLRLEGDDIAGLATFNVQSDFGSHVIEQNNLMDSQRIKFSIRYKFNTAASKYKGRGAGQDAIGRMKSK